MVKHSKGLDTSFVNLQGPLHKKHKDLIHIRVTALLMNMIQNV